MVGIVPINDAVQMAEERGYDLVEVAPGANPPVCRLMDFGQYKYELAKKAKDAKKKQKVIKLKEIKVRPKTDEGDLQTKCNAIRKFLDDGDKVKISVAFRGREKSTNCRSTSALSCVRWSCWSSSVRRQNGSRCP